MKKFQTCDNVRVALLSVTAAGVGLTLTAASTVIFAELHWTPGVLAQAEDRCHRIGQVNAVQVLYCICKDEDLSIDMTLWRMLSRKVGNVARLVDGTKVSLIYSVRRFCELFHSPFFLPDWHYICLGSVTRSAGIVQI